MEAEITELQLNLLISYIIQNWETYSPQFYDGKSIFAKLKKIGDIKLFGKKPIISFKKILLPNGANVEEFSANKKIAFFLVNCDVWALHFFLNEFLKTSILTKRENILIITTDCQPEKSCFCNEIGLDKIAPFDLYIREPKKGKYNLFSGSAQGREIIKKLEIKSRKQQTNIDTEIEIEKNFDLDKIAEAISDKETNEEFFSGIANNCFGCGACSTVCPLCFCTRQVFENNLSGETTQCLHWDSCFAKRFSEVQNRLDLRPENKDRLYNWYHHKFVRAKSESGHFLCTGCGRCIDACPANLNVKNILKALVEKEDN